MKKYGILILTTLLSWFQGTAQTPDSAHQAADTIAQSLLWKVSHPDWAEASYLFGTIHMIGEADFFWPEKLKASLAQTRQLALEVDMDDPSQMALILTGGMMQGGETLAGLIDSAAYQRVSQFFADSVRMPITMLQRMKPMRLSSMFYPLIIKGETLSYEMELLKLAKAAKMEITGVESMADQLAMMDSIPYVEQAEMLVTAVDSFQAQKEQLQALIDVYRSQNLAQLQALMGAQEDLADYEDVMLNDRNQRWIPVMQRESARVPTFYAVGAGHLAGPQGVLAGLRAQGCRVEPVL